MGRFKDDMQVNPTAEILKNQGFEKESGARGNKGYTKVYSVGSDFYR